MPLHVRGRATREKEHCTKCKKEKKNEGQFLYVIAVLYFILLVNNKKHFLHVYFLSFRKTKTHLVSHTSPDLATTSVLNRLPTTIWEMFCFVWLFFFSSLFLYELYRDR